MDTHHKYKPSLPAIVRDTNSQLKRRGRIGRRLIGSDVRLEDLC